MAKPAAKGGITVVRGGNATSPLGFVAGAVYAGIKAPGKDKLDLGILASDGPASVAAMFTRNVVRGDAVVMSQLHGRGGIARAIIVNAGVSNVANGPRGWADAQEMCELAAAKVRARTNEILVGSTGVIGKPLPMEKIRAGVPRIVLTQAGGYDFARAIMTTDTRPKTMAVRFDAGGHRYTMGAVAKGVGMIHPDMATMFCFVTTDAEVHGPYLRRAFRAAVNDSLNMISVDGDTSTSDMAVLLANGAAGGPQIGENTPEATAFEAALRHVCTAMAKMLARDGEGAEKLIEVRIEGAMSHAEARAAARTVTASPLVKTAVHGNDPNWGRLLMAVGRSHARIDLRRARVWLGTTMVYSGEPLAFDERAASAHLRKSDVLLRVDLAVGRASATAWGCDLTPEYVHINSDYTT
ncbi:MAG TPA: bifunctional glutamate N-acetyltransferase/amino-acid acetyltransferase ArgJ [Dehalococcoidia bacterium]|nr:bifunctional glutamate N-acetyltransferase/amino-acid acetyltransferase ArgJ [Dehalococcoidia bacterium]